MVFTHLLLAVCLELEEQPQVPLVPNSGRSVISERRGLPSTDVIRFDPVKKRVTRSRILLLRVLHTLFPRQHSYCITSPP